MPEEPKDKIAIRCACGTKLAVPASAIGKNAKCPKCGKVFPIAPPSTGRTAQEQSHTVPQAAGRAAKPAAAPRPHRLPHPAPKADADDSTDSLLDMLAKQEKTAEATSPPAAGRLQTPCPKCHAMMTPDSKVCVACGYNVETGRAAKGARAQPVAAVKVAKFAGRFTIGIALSGVGALVGAGIWYGIAAASDYEIGYVAWAVGLLAGLGMKLGYQREDALAGFVAAGMACVGIFAAKILYFTYVLTPAVGADPGSIAIQRAVLASILAIQNAPADSASSNGQPTATTQAISASDYEKAKQQVAAMNDAEVCQRLEEYRRAHSQEPDDDPSPTDSRGLTNFFNTCFGAIDILFILLAVGTAYKLASGGGGE